MTEDPLKEYVDALIDDDRLDEAQQMLDVLLEARDMEEEENEN